MAAFIHYGICTMWRSAFPALVTQILNPLARSFLLFLSFVGGSHAGLPTAMDGQALPSLAPMVERVSPAVVNIATSATVESPVMRDPFFGFMYKRPPRKINSLGSGVIVDAQKGYILTNHHVIGNADEITVTLVDGRELRAQIVGSDEDTDIAVIKVDNKNLNSVSLADSDKLRVGDFVVAIGNPFSLGHTVTSGIVSALGRQGLGIENIEQFIQTDAAINPGNSGGALLNLRGDLVGINTAIVGPSGGNVGIGFAIPINVAHHIMQQLVQFGEVRRGVLGISSSDDVTADLAKALEITQTSGVIINRVTEKSAADKAGLQMYDIIVGINGKPIRNRVELNNQLGLLPIESTVTLEVVRDNKRMTISAKLSAKQEKISGASIHALLEGVTLKLKQERGEDAGFEVLSLSKNARAAQFGLAKGDIIVALGRYRVRSLAEFKDLAKTTRSLPLNILRQDESFLIVIK